MLMLSRPLAPAGARGCIAAFTDGRPGGVAETGDPTGRGRIAKDRSGTKRKDGQRGGPAGGPAAGSAVGPEDGAATAEGGWDEAVPAEDAAMDEAADHSPPPAAPEDAAVVVTRHREHRFPGRRRPVQVRFGEEEFAAIELAAGRA